MSGRCIDCFPSEKMSKVVKLRMRERNCLPEKERDILFTNRVRERERSRRKNDKQQTEVKDNVLAEKMLVLTLRGTGWLSKLFVKYFVFNENATLANSSIIVLP